MISTYNAERNTASPRTMYYQDWRCYNGAVNHMWRFYCQKQNVTVSELSDASRSAWFACHKVFSTMSAIEQDVIMQYYSVPFANRTTDGNLQRIADSNGLTISEARIVLDKAARMVAVERGLADPPRACRKEAL